MRAWRSTTATLLLLAWTQTGCGPQGQVRRTIHPALNLAEREAQDQREKAQSSLKRTRPGLPIHCLREVRSPDEFCISCEDGEIDLERCYDFQGTFDEAKNCVYSQENIKCLNGKPPFALNLAIKGSLEKTLVENARLWQESLRAIVEPRLDADMQKALEKGLLQTTALVKVLVQARKNPQWIEEHFASAPAPLKQALADLQRGKEEGHLKLLQVLKVSRSLLEATDTPPSLLPYWEALSVEGLEEPGD